MAETPHGNLFLDALSPAVFRSLNARKENHPIAEILSNADETSPFVFFPHDSAVVSIVRSTADGWMVEAGVIGSEGLFDLQTLITDPAPTGNQAIVQIDGRFSRIDASLLRDLFRDDVVFRDHVLAFTNAFLAQVTQNLVCNRLHPIEQRLAKWLLIVRDRTRTDDLHLTHDFLAHMLGIHRPGVSIAIGALEIDGLIHHSRNLITIRNRDGLLERSCECYEAVHRSLVDYRESFAGMNVRHHTDATVDA